MQQNRAYKKRNHQIFFLLTSASYAPIISPDFLCFCLHLPPPPSWLSPLHLALRAEVSIILLPVALVNLWPRPSSSSRCQITPSYVSQERLPWRLDEPWLPCISNKADTNTGCWIVDYTLVRVKELLRPIKEFIKHKLHNVTSCVNANII